MTQRSDIRLTTAFPSSFIGSFRSPFLYMHSLHPVSKLIFIDDLLCNLIRLASQSRQRIKLIELPHLLSSLQRQAGLFLPLFLLARESNAHKIALLEVFPLFHLAIQRQIARAPHVYRVRPVRNLVTEFLCLSQRDEATLINALDAILSRSFSRRCSSLAASRSEYGTAAILGGT